MFSCLFKILLVSLFIFSCQKAKFSPTEDFAALNNPILFEDSFKVSKSEFSFIQPDLSENKTRLSFHIDGANGLQVPSLLENEIKLSEDGVEINTFTLGKVSTTSRSTVDIIFAVDVTQSMASTIESAKLKLTEFVKNSRAQGYHTRMCVSTFGDYTVKKCLRFYNNDPKAPNSEIEINELISEISKLKALLGADDPGGRDFDENPMRAVIDAASAPWESDSQRFLILVTDAGFLYSPGNIGSNPKATAPKYTEVLQAIDQSKMKIFAATPNLSGYNLPFVGNASIVKQSDGEWFSYSDLVQDKISLNTILNRILSQVNTTFYVDYNLDSQSDLDPSRPLSVRKIELQLISSQIGIIKNMIITSNLPNGRFPDPKGFVFSQKNILKSSLKVYIDDVLQTSRYKIINDSAGTQRLEFVKALKPNSKVKLSYQYEKLSDAILLRPIQFRLNAKYLEKIQVRINDMVVNPQDYNIISIGQDNYSVNINESVYSDEDPYAISRSIEMNLVIRVTE